MEILLGSKTALAKKLGISRSSLYYKPKKPPSDDTFAAMIRAVMLEHPAYGTRRVAIHLGANRKKTKRIMNARGMKPRIRRGFCFTKPDRPRKA